MRQFRPFDNNAQSLQIGGLIIENQTDKITIYGDIDIHIDLKGLHNIRHLQSVINDIEKTLTLREPYLEEQSNCQQRSDEKSIQKQSSNIRPNPFA